MLQAIKPVILCCAIGAAVLPQAGRAGDSPFVQGAGGAAGTAAGGPPEAYELAGASVTDGGIQVCVFDTQAKKSRWIAVGSTADKIQVVSYDPRTERAVIRVDGSQREVGLRHARVASGGAPTVRSARQPSASFTSNPAPAAPQPLAGIQPPPPPPGKTAEMLKEEREARMLVSDLLDISMQQRKAYEEAQKKASQPPPANTPQP